MAIKKQIEQVLSRRSTPICSLGTRRLLTQKSRNLKGITDTRILRKPFGLAQQIPIFEAFNLEDQCQYQPPLKVAFCGAGIFFWWELGGIEWLREHYNLAKVPMIGASGGALAATLAATGVDPDAALKSAHRLGKEYGIWERPLGLAGVWGEIIRRWLEELLPENAAELCRDRVELIVTTLPSFQLKTFSDFESKADLIDVNMASVHVPFFLDWRAAAMCRGKWCIDGSFQDFLTSTNSDLLVCNGNSVLLDYFQDVNLEFERMDFLKLKEYNEVKRLMQLGYDHAQMLSDMGIFDGFDASSCQKWRWWPKIQLALLPQN